MPGRITQDRASGRFPLDLANVPVTWALTREWALNYLGYYGTYNVILYSGKFLLVQTFAELLVSPLQRGFNFRNRCGWAYSTHTYHSNFAVLTSRGADLFTKNTKVYTMRKFPAIRYNVLGHWKHFKASFYTCT